LRGLDAAPDLWALVNSFRVSQALYVATTLRLADLLKDDKRTAEELAREAHADPDALYRLMRALASIGVFHEHSDATFSLNMLVMPGGRERTIAEFSALFAQAGFALTGVSGGDPIAVIEAMPEE
jgi:hypothetical protein